MSKPVRSKKQKLTLSAEPKKVIEALMRYLCSQAEDKEADFLIRAFGQETAKEIAEKFSNKRQSRIFAKALRRFICRCIRAERRRQLKAARKYRR